MNHVEEVKSYAPHILHVVADLHCRPAPPAAAAPEEAPRPGGSAAQSSPAGGAPGPSGRRDPTMRAPVGLLTLHRPTKEELARGPAALRRPAILTGATLPFSSRPPRARDSLDFPGE